MSAHASASSGATSSISRPRVWLGGGFLALLAFAVWLGTGASDGKAAAGECPNEAIRIAQSATHLPNCRAYERISPGGGGGVAGVNSVNQLMFGALRADGDAATFGSSSALGDPERGGPENSNLAHRSGSGWSSFSVLTTTEPGVPMDLALAPALPTPSSDMTREMFVPGRSLGPPNPVTAGGSTYLSAPAGKGPPTWLSRWTFEGTQPNPSPTMQLPLGGAPDFSSGYFRYPTPLTNLAGDNLRTNNHGLYFFEGSTISPAGVLPSGNVNPLGALPAGTGQENFGGGLAELARNQVSADGSKLFFVSPAEGAGTKQLYVQEGGDAGRLISHDALGDAAAAGISTLRGAAGQSASASFAYATPDGSRVILRSESALTADAPAEGVKTYRAEITPSSIALTYLPAVDGTVLTVDKDASTILFSKPGSEADKVSYYVWDESHPGSLHTVATDLNSGGGSPQGPTMLEPVLSDDGDVLVFTSGAEVEPGVAPLPEINYTQVYRWTEKSGAPDCISCRRDGGTPARFGSRTGNYNGLPTDNPAFPGGNTPDFFNQASVVGNRKISSDGSRVFFDTNDPLDLARDVNGVRDVYMWEDGQVHLLTSGRNPVPSQIIDSSVSGDDVMLVTKDGLVPSDTDQTYDVYDIRVGGGFAEPVDESCAGDACQAPSAVPPAASSPASRSIRGSGNQHQVRLGGLRIAQRGKAAASARVRVIVPAAGRVRLSGDLVEPKARKVKAKGSVVLKVELTAGGKRKLARNGQLRTRVTVSFRDADGRNRQRATTLRFKQGGAR